MEWDIVDDVIVNILYSMNAEEWKGASTYTGSGIMADVYFRLCDEMWPMICFIECVCAI